MSSVPQKDEFTRKRLMHVVLWASFMAVVFFFTGLGIQAIMGFSGAGEAASAGIINLTSNHVFANVLLQQGLSTIALGNLLPYVLVLTGLGIGATVGYLTYKEE